MQVSCLPIALLSRKARVDESTPPERASKLSYHQLVSEFLELSHLKIFSCPIGFAFRNRIYEVLIKVIPNSE